jgi:hypothetical protein
MLGSIWWRSGWTWRWVWPPSLWDILIGRLGRRCRAMQRLCRCASGQALQVCHSCCHSTLSGECRAFWCAIDIPQAHYALCALCEAIQQCSAWSWTVEVSGHQGPSPHEAPCPLGDSWTGSLARKLAAGCFAVLYARLAWATS